jgi:hypothetical protein
LKKSISDIEAGNALPEGRRNQIGEICIHKILLPLPEYVGSAEDRRKTLRRQEGKIKLGKSKYYITDGLIF